MSFYSVGEEIIAGTLAGLYKGGTEIMAESQDIVPVEFGTLKRSGMVEQPVVDGDSATVTLGYGYGTEVGPDGEMAVQYAVYVHEIERYKHAPPTTWKYLERPAAEYGGKLAPTINAEIKTRIGGV